jgi:hypothetical protein
VSEFLAYCGSRCDLCPRYQATLKGDIGRLAELAELWHRCGWRDRILPAEEMMCHGCVETIWCRYEIPACAAGKGADNCGVCEDYTSCERLKEMFKRNHAYAEKCKTLCSDDEYELLRLTCFDKKANLDRARKIRSKGKSW